MSDELTLHVNKKYDLLTLIKQGGVVRLKIMLDEMFFMSEAVVTALQGFIKKFALQGPTRTVGENIHLLIQQYEACCTRLTDVNQLLLKAST